ncbi:hypothetical protein [Nocardia macrotermitis]|uniref:hypothetical protein n=1 Tax=Nocardia macrotermitis TaxID=2585198 RepID=UPI001294A7E7|nr:hypothetical protein [Nocardia macrotermitis]
MSVHSEYSATFGHLSRTVEMMEVSGVQRRVAGEWSVPLGEPQARPDRGAVERDRARILPWCPQGWLLLELPTALLLAVFVGTGWLGYAQHGRPTTDGPLSAVVVPTPVPPTAR